MCVTVMKISRAAGFVRGGALHSGERSLISGAMSIFPKPVSPKSALGDFWTYFSEKRAHKWPLLGLAMSITWVIVWVFLLDSKTNTAPRQNKIMYVQSWDANRPDAVIIAKQKADIAKGEMLLEKNQKDMQKVADMVGIEWREEEARNRARRQKALKAINEMLDKRLEKAKASETAAAANTASAKVAQP